jgi:DNA polymerase III subunit epsilon
MIRRLKTTGNDLSHNDKGLLMDDAEYVVVDTELTGLNEKKDSIVSIGAVKMNGGRIDLSNTFYRLLNPETSLTAESVVIHEITPDEVVEKPDIRTGLGEFLRFCGDDIIVGFCVNIDMEFLNREAKRILGHTIKNQVLDIFPLFEWVRSSKEARDGEEIKMPVHYKLYDIAKHYGIEVNGAHNAMIDAFITAQIFQRFIPILFEAGIRSVGDVLRLSNKLKGGDRFAVNRGMSNF